MASRKKTQHGVGIKGEWTYEAIPITRSGCARGTPLLLVVPDAYSR